MNLAIRSQNTVHENVIDEWNVIMNVDATCNEPQDQGPFSVSYSK